MKISLKTAVDLRDLRIFKIVIVFLPNVNVCPGVGESEEMRARRFPCAVRASEIRKAAIDAPPV
jgi:hypothetical protein